MGAGWHPETRRTVDKADCNQMFLDRARPPAAAEHIRHIRINRLSGRRQRRYSRCLAPSRENPPIAGIDLQRRRVELPAGAPDELLDVGQRRPRSARSAGEHLHGGFRAHSMKWHSLSFPP